MELDMVANMEVDKIADKGAYMVADIISIVSPIASVTSVKSRLGTFNLHHHVNHLVNLANYNL